MDGLDGYGPTAPTEDHWCPVPAPASLRLAAQALPSLALAPLGQLRLHSRQDAGSGGM